MTTPLVTMLEMMMVQKPLEQAKRRIVGTIEITGIVKKVGVTRNVHEKVHDQQMMPTACVIP